MDYTWIKNMTTDDERLCVSFNDIESSNDGDTCISCVTHYLLKDLSGAVCIDVGADIGWWGLFCKYIKQSAHVYAFEPNPTSFSRLDKHSSDTFHTFNCAVSNKDGEIHMIEMGKDELNTLPIGKNKSLSAEKFYQIYDSIK